MSASLPPSRTARLWLSLALAAVVALVYAQTQGFEFVRYDDPEYVLRNTAVRGGLTWDGLRWAFTAAHSSNWHPLTWLSHMLDVELYGLEPGGHHLSSVLLHALATLLCFQALVSLSARLWASALVAALFALHPLRVESVAWVSERKDVLSGCAFFALLWAHATWARAVRSGTPSWRRVSGRHGFVVFACLLLGLLAKPMLVTAPFVLLLLDYWPLGRLGAHDGGRGPRLAKLVREKIPLLLLSAGSIGAALWSQRVGGSLSTLDKLSLSERLANAPVALVRYLEHFFWPHDLAYFYPHPALLEGAGTPLAKTLLASAAIVGFSLAVARGARRLPALFTGWFWFLGMLVPVIGVVQVGEQALADRYAYLPMVGLQIALVFPLCALAARWSPGPRRIAAGLAGAALVACGLLAARQARVWKTSETLFTHAIEVTQDNYPAWVGLANLRRDSGAVEEAHDAYGRALALRADYGPALYGLGLLEQEHGELARAIELYERALAAQPGLVVARLNLGSCLAGTGRTVEAALCFERVLELEPDQAHALFNLGLLSILAQRLPDAQRYLEASVASEPRHEAAWEKLGDLRLALGDTDGARAAFERADSIQGRGTARRKLVWLLLRSALPAERTRALHLAGEDAQRDGGRDPHVLEALAAALAANGDFARAVEVQRSAARLLPPELQSRARTRLERYGRGQTVIDGP